MLKFLASRATPQSAGSLIRELGIPKSSAYEVLGELAAAGFVVHLPDERRWGLGIASFEIGSAYLRQDSLERLGRPLLSGLAHTSSHIAHLGVLHGAQTLYLLKERRPGSRTPHLITEVGVRLPAHLTATGRSILALLPAAQVRALFPGPEAFVDRTGEGDRTPTELQQTLSLDKARGWSVEHGQITVGLASVAAAVCDHTGRPIASIGVTFAHQCPANCSQTWPSVADQVLAAARSLTVAIGGITTGPLPRPQPPPGRPAGARRPPG